MSIKTLMATVFGAALMLSAMSALPPEATAEDEKTVHEKTVPACCMSGCARGVSHAKDETGAMHVPGGHHHAPGTMHASGTTRCSLTGQAVATCCPMHDMHDKDGTVRCNLEDKGAGCCCCCKPATDETDTTEDTNRTRDDEAQR